MILVIDIGNTRTKWALADNKGNLIDINAVLNTDIALSNLMQAAKRAKSAVIANVAGEHIAQQVLLLLNHIHVYFVTATAQACGVSNQYQQPEKLGVDRWAALIGAWHISQKTSLVVNVGTAITIDVLDRKGLFLGGSIMPGFRLMRESLYAHTAQLKIGQGTMRFFANNTQDAIESGCLTAAAGAIVLTANHLKTLCDDFAIIMTGGDADKLNEVLNLYPKQGIMCGVANIQIVPQLVLQGLVLLHTDLR